MKAKAKKPEPKKTKTKRFEKETAKFGVIKNPAAKEPMPADGAVERVGKKVAGPLNKRAIADKSSKKRKTRNGSRT